MRQLFMIFSSRFYCSANRRSIIADQLDAGAGGVSVSIDATARMMQVARKKRGNQTKLYMSSANVINFGLPKNVCCVMII
jgi:hypothetical protein